MGEGVVGGVSVLRSGIDSGCLPHTWQAYSAIAVAGELAKAFGTDVNGLPLSLDLSWLEQKAVAVLLTLLHLGLRNIRCAPCVRRAYV